MKAKLSLATALLLAGSWIACSGGGHSNPTIPKFLVALDGCPSSPCAATTNVNVFPINPTTGALGTAVTGAPFNMGLADPMTVEVHPNGKWFYVADGSDGSIHQWDVNESTGVPTDIAAKMVNESGSFYEPTLSWNQVGDSGTHVLTVTPNGKYLYSTNNDATVGAYSIGSNGALTHIADANITGCASGDPDDSGAITSTDNFVWVTDTCASQGDWHVITLKVGSNGSLTQTSSITLTGVDTFLWSIQINPAADFLYAGDDGGNAQIFGFKVAADGSLTQLTLGTTSQQFQDDVDGNGVTFGSSDCRFIEHSPDGKFFYWTDDDDFVHTLSVNTTSGAIAELAAPASPYQVQASGTTTKIGGEGQIAVDVTGKFVYAAEVYSNGTGTTGGVLTFTRDATTGALTMVGTTDTSTANSQAIALGIVR
jgi:6-phosphogluconolactonase (cycloisomerase 2 family)